MQPESASSRCSSWIEVSNVALLLYRGNAHKHAGSSGAVTEHRKNPTVKFDRVFFASILWLTTVGCAASLPDLKDPLAPDEQLISLPTRRNVTVRILLRTPSNSPKGTFLFFPGSEGSLVNNEGRPRWDYTRTLPELGFATAIVDMPSDKPYGAWAGDRFRTSTEHVEDVKKIIEFVNQKWLKPTLVQDSFLKNLRLE